MVGLNPRITLEPGKISGKPCIRGLRITVYDVASYLASRMTEEEILRDFPYLEKDDFRVRVLRRYPREDHRSLRLLFDENLAPRLVDLLADLFSGSLHVSSVQSGSTPDAAIWEYAKDNLSMVWGAPPKVVWCKPATPRLN